MKCNKTWLLALGLILMTGLVSAAWAQDDEDAGKRDLIKNRTYIGFLGTSATIDQWGDFQGLLTFTSISSDPASNVEKDIVPTINRNFGFGVLVGHREGPWAAEVSFMRSDHTATFTGGSAVTITEPASLCSINFDFKRYFLTTLPVQPFINMGLSLPWLWIRQGSSLYDSTVTTLLMVNDETISGIGFNLGGGIEIYLNQDISLLGGAYQRFTSFDQISGAAKIPFDSLQLNNNATDIGSIEGDGLHFYAGATFGFQM